MRLTLGTAPRPVDEPSAVGLLLACHARIRGQVELARALVGAAGAPVAVIEDAARDLVRYHTIALPLHQQDEELSVRPRLEVASGRGAVRAALECMGAEHLEIDVLLADLVPRWAEIAGDPGRLPRLAAELAPPTEALAALWDRHLAGEESVVFPAIVAALPSAERDAIAEEIRGRRRAAP